MNFTIDISIPFYGNGTSLEVVAFPHDETYPPVTIATLPVAAREGDVEIVIPEGEEFDGEIFVFEFFAGSWQEAREDQDASLLSDIMIAV
jgi:hypothetical protein